MIIKVNRLIINIETSQLMNSNNKYLVFINNFHKICNPQQSFLDINLLAGPHNIAILAIYTSVIHSFTNYRKLIKLKYIYSIMAIPCLD